MKDSKDKRLPWRERPKKDLKTKKDFKKDFKRDFPADAKRSPPRIDRPSLSPNTYLVEGAAALTEYLRLRPKAIKQIFCVPTSEREARRIAGNAAPIRVVAEGESRDGTSPVWAHVSLQSLDEDSFMGRAKARTRDLVIALDHVVDPRNVGAIVRTAAFFGVKEVVVPERRQALITNSGVATAQGGFAACDLVPVVNLGRTLERLKELGYWIVGTDMEGEELGRARIGFDKAVLVMGSEESGMGALVRKGCDLIVSIPVPAAQPVLESLNVSVAAGIFIHAFSRRNPA